MRTVLWGLILLTMPGLLQAGELAVEPNPDPESEALAIEAHQILTDHCAEVEGTDTTLAAQSVTVVSEVWARISAQLEKSGKEYLLYWRGVLGQCLNQDERALQDLRDFVSQLEEQDSDLWASLVVDANTRVRRLEQAASQTGPRPQTVVGLVLGGSLSGVAVAAGIGSGLRWQEALDIAADLYPQQVNYEDHSSDIRTGDSLARTSQALAGLAIGCGAGAAVSFVIAALAPGSSGQTALIAPVLVPTRTGVVAVWEGRW